MLIDELMIAMICFVMLILRIKCSFSNEDDAKDLTWHANGRISDGMVHHPANCSQWKKMMDE